MFELRGTLRYDLPQLYLINVHFYQGNATEAVTWYNKVFIVSIQIQQHAYRLLNIKLIILLLNN